MKLKIIFFITYYFFFINISYGLEPFFIFQIKKIILNINPKADDINSEILKILIPNNIYLPLKLGSSKIQINSYLSFSQSFLSIGEENCLINSDKIHNISNSTSYKYISEITLSNIDKRIYQKSTYFEESIIFQSNIEEIKMENFSCFSYINNDAIRCSILGLDLSYEKSQQNIFKIILDKYQNQIKNSYFSIIFNNQSNILKENININNNDYIDGEILLGIPPHEYYKNRFYDKELIEINTQCSRDHLSWIIRFESVYLEDSLNNSKKYFTFNKMTFYDLEDYFGVFFPEINPIYVPNNIFDYYINNYFSKYLNNECLKRGRNLYNKYITNNIFKLMQIFIYCDKNKIRDKEEFYEKFPSLNLKNVFFKETFVFKGKELFLEDENFIYFMLLPEFDNKNKFLLGKMFMMKYQFTFNYDSKTIGYYNKNFNLNNSNKISNNKNIKSNINNLHIVIIIFFSIFFLIGLIFIIIYCKNYFDKKEKNEKEALELSYMKKGDENIK